MPINLCMMDLPLHSALHAVSLCVDTIHQKVAEQEHTGQALAAMNQANNLRY